MSIQDLNESRRPPRDGPRGVPGRGTPSGRRDRVLSRVAAPAPGGPGRDPPRREVPAAGGPAGGGDRRLDPPRRDRPPGVRSLRLQRPPPLLRLHHVLGGAGRGPRRPPGGVGEPQRRGVGAVSGRLRDRGPERPVDRRDAGDARRDRGPPRQRRQHGQLRVLPRRPPREGRRGAPRAGAAPRRRSPPRLRLDRDPHLDPEGGRPVRPRDREHPLDPGGDGPHDRRVGPAPADRDRPRATAIGPSCSWATRAP